MSKKDTIDNIPLREPNEKLTATTHKKYVSDQAIKSGAYIIPAGEKVCKICFRGMTYNREAGVFECRHKDCKPRNGLVYDWSIPEGYEPKHLRASITREEYERQHIGSKR